MFLKKQKSETEKLNRQIEVLKKQIEALGAKRDELIAYIAALKAEVAAQPQIEIKALHANYNAIIDHYKSRLNDYENLVEEIRTSLVDGNNAINRFKRGDF